MPTRRPSPRMFGGDALDRHGRWLGACRRACACGVRTPCARRRLDVAGHLEVEAGHARHLARLREQPHPADVEVAQDLRADAVVAQVHLRPATGGCVGDRAARAAPRALSGRCSSTMTPRPASAIARQRRRRCSTSATSLSASSRSITDSGSCTRTSVSVSGADRPAHQREMRRVGELVAIDDEPERAVRRRRAAARRCARPAARCGCGSG